MAWFDQDGNHIYYEESGIGAPLLLMPGWGTGFDDLQQLRDALTPIVRVIAADLPGSGKSGPQPRTYHAGYYAEDAPVFIALQRALDIYPAHLVGFSDGGEYALLMAATEPACASSIVTWGSAGKLPQAPELAGAMSSMIDAPPPPMQGFADYLKATYGEDNARIMTKSFGQALTDIMAAGGDISSSRAGNIACPTLLITGEHDFFAPPPLVRELQAAIPGSEFVDKPGASHPIHHEEPEWLIGTITGWLKQRA
jgi:valacyclovir hydrolase